MATITIALSGSSIVNGSKSYTVDDATLRKVLDVMAARFFHNPQSPPTDQQVLLAWVQGWINDTKTQVSRVTLTQAQAAAAAAVSVPPIVIS